MKDNHIIVLVDGHCSLCKGWTHWVIHRDVADRLRFASQQGEIGKKLLDDNGVKSGHSVVVIHDDRVYTKSRAVLEVARVLSWPWPAVYPALFIPWFVRDWAYSLVANHRYNWFGREEENFCEVDGNLAGKLLK